jgi:hypothetical protein
MLIARCNSARWSARPTAARAGPDAAPGSSGDELGECFAELIGRLRVLPGHQGRRTG